MLKKDFKNTRRLISFLLISLMILSFIGSFAVEARDLNEIHREKIDLKVFNNFENEKYTEVIVYLKEQLIEDGKNYLEKELFIKELKDLADDTQIDLINYLNSEKIKGNVVEYKPYYIINGLYVKASEEVIKKMATMDEVKMIYSNALIEIDRPETSELMSENDNSIEWNIDRIGASKVWNELSINGQGVVIGIIDSGVHWQHEALREKWRGYNSNDPENPVSEGNWFDAISGKDLPYDEPGHYHGTHVAGIILGQDKEGNNKIGVAPGAKWIAARAFTKQGAYPNWLLEAGEWMLAPNGDPSLAPDIINNSWGTTTPKDGLDEWYRGMVQAWRAAGILPVFATGNDTGRGGAQPGSVAVPANYPESFAVGAVDKDNVLGKFSKKGPSPYEGEIKPDLVAPGLTDAEIPASPSGPAVPATGIRSSVPGGYREMLGTSMAAPHVSGAAALLLSANKGLTVDEIENILTSTATPLIDNNYTESPNQGYGHGLVNAYEAVKTQIDTDTKGIGTINGKVLAEVEEFNELEILHEPLKEYFQDTLVFIKGRAKGDIGIKEVKLLLKIKDEWQEISMDLEMGSAINGLYSAAVPEELIHNGEFTYKIKAIDKDNSFKETEEYTVTKGFGIIPDEYETDFSQYPIGWKFEGDWEWGQVYNLPYIYDGLDMVGTNLSGNYSSNTTSTLEMPPVDLRNNELEHVVLKINHFREFDLFNDVASILISTDNKQSWDELESFAGQYNYYWERFSFLEEIALDLTPYIGNNDPIYIRFQLESDDDTEMRGWYLDSIKLIGTDNEAPKSPKSLKAEEYPIGVILSWVAPWSSDVSKYRIYRSIAEDVDYELIGETVSRNYLDLDVKAGEKYFYKVSAVDIFGNESVSSLKGVSINIESLGDKIYFTDFEEDDGGFTSGVENNHWQWGVPRRSVPNEAFTGSKLWGTNLLGKYDGNVSYWIETPEIILPDDAMSYLSFHHWLNAITGDYGEVLISQKEDEGWSEWQSIGSQYKTISRDVVWKEENVNLTEYKGKTVKFRFVLNSLKGDEEVYTTGWYIDDVLIYSVKEEMKTDSMEFNNFKEIGSSVENVPIHLDKYGKLQSDVKLIPVDATISILETGNSARVDLNSAYYELNPYVSKMGENFRLKVEAYGYETQEVEVELSAGEIVTKDFILKKARTGSVSGKLVDGETGKAIEGANIKIKEDSKIDSTLSDGNGIFEIKNIPQGKYTLIIEKPEYEFEEIEITVEKDLLNLDSIKLKKSKKYSTEIRYDDGIAERAVVGNSTATRIAGTAIRMTPLKYGKLMGTNIYFTDESYPIPGGNRIGIAIFTAGEDGMPNGMHKAPIFFNIKRDSWNYLDLSSLDFWTDEDFFIATVQDDIWDFMPAVGVDNDTVEDNRSYMYMNDNFFDIGDRFGTGIPGTLMIRGIMDYSAKDMKYPLDIGKIDIIESDVKINIKANVINISDSDLHGTIILKPMDNNGRPYKVINKDICFNRGMNVIEFELNSKDYPKGIKDMNIYIWDNLSNMRPLADKY